MPPRAPVAKRPSGKSGWLTSNPERDSKRCSAVCAGLNFRHCLGLNSAHNTIPSVLMQIVFIWSCYSWFDSIRE
jgi:hypothetical protein